MLHDFKIAATMCDREIRFRCARCNSETRHSNIQDLTSIGCKSCNVDSREVISDDVRASSTSQELDYGDASNSFERSTVMPYSKAKADSAVDQSVQRDRSRSPKREHTASPQNKTFRSRSPLLRPPLSPRPAMPLVRLPPVVNDIPSPAFVPTGPRKSNESNNDNFQSPDRYRDRASSRDIEQSQRLQQNPTHAQESKTDSTPGRIADCAAAMRNMDKPFVGLGYPAIVGEEDWCLSCHDTGHQPQHCTKKWPDKKLNPSQQSKWLQSVPTRYLLSTHRTQPRTLRALVKEILIHGVDHVQHSEYIQQRDRFFDALMTKMSRRRWLSNQKIWLRFMSSANHGMKICVQRLMSRPLEILKNTIRDKYMLKDENMDDFVTRVFAFAPHDDPMLPTEVFERVMDQLLSVPVCHRAWLMDMSFIMGRYVASSPKMTKLGAEEREWMSKAFRALLDAQPQFEFRDSTWIRHLSYPDLNAIDRGLLRVREWSC